MSENTAKTKHGTDDVLQKSVFSLAWPIFFQSLLGIALGYIDTIMLSNYSETAVGAIGNANSVLSFLALAFTVISSATGIMVSQYLGANKKEEMNRIYTIALAFNLVLSVVIKPTPSISKPQQSVNLQTMEEETLVIKGRHDPCIVPRAVPVVEGAVAFGLLDMMM